MEGRGRSRRRNTRQEWKRRLSSALAVVLTAAMVLNMPLSIDSLGLHVSNAFASGSNADREGGLWATASNAKYQKGQSQDVDIYVIAEDNEAAPGNTSSMTLYLKNNTGQTITEGTLSFKGNHIAKQDGYFEDMGTAQADSPTVIVGGEDPTKQTEASGEGMLYEEDGEDSKESIDGEASLGDQDGIAGGDDADADANDADDEDAEEEESHKLTDIDLQPGEMREIRFTYYTDDEENSTKAYVEFSFHGEDENETAVRSSSKFYYSIGLPFVNFSMEDGIQIESGVSNDMEIWMSEPTWVDEALEERIEKQEEEEAEKAYKDEETEPADTASGSNADKASDSNASKDIEDTDTQKDQDKINQYKEEAMTISKVSYDVEIYGAELERFSPRKAEEVEDLGWISCIYEVANDTEPGVYYGKVTANGRWNNRKFTSEQGFLFEVTGEGKTGQEFTKELDKVIVHAYAEEGVLEEGVKLTAKELRQEDAETAEQFNEAKDALDAEGTEYDGMMALDISFVDKDGQEVEPNGDVQVSIEMKKDALPEDIDLETVEVHHMKEVDNTVEVEPVADGADKTDGTVKSAKAAVAELKEAEVPKEEIEAAVSDEAVAVAEFSVGSFSPFVITWKEWKTTYFRINLHYADEDGKEFSEEEIAVNKNNSITNGKTIKFIDYADQLNNSSFKFKEAHYGSCRGSVVESVTAKETYGWSGSTTQSLIFKGDNFEKKVEYSKGGDNTYDVWLVYEPGETVAPSQPTGKELSKSKKAEWNEDTETYDLSLSISGAIGSLSQKAKVDILFIIDTSDSMNDSLGWSGTKISKVKTATNQLITNIEKNQNIDAEYNVVAFGSQAYKLFDEWQDNEDSVKRSITAMELATKHFGSGWYENAAYGGTNYEDAIEMGIKQLQSSRRDAERYVIFLSDGLPTFKNSGTRDEQYGSYPWYGTGNGNSIENGNVSSCLSAAVTAIRGMSCDAFYTLGVGGNYEDALQDLVDAVDAEIKPAPMSATNTTELNEAFDKISGDITTLLCTDVTVTDTLSEYAKAVLGTDGKPRKLKITVDRKDEEELVGDGTVTIPSTDQNKSAIITADYNEMTKQLVLNFPDWYQLEADWIYTVTMEIDATEAAYEAYREAQDPQNPYPDTPDEGTGTHADLNQKGFFSNAEATVTYTYNEKEKTENFDCPVIQVHPGTLIITKEIKGDLTEADRNALINQLGFVVEYSWPGDGEPQVKEKTYSLSALQPEASGKYQFVISGLSPETTYSVSERDYLVDGYQWKGTDNPKSGTIEKGGIQTVDFVNEYSKQDVTLSVTKQVAGNMADQNRDFNFSLTLMKDDVPYNSPITGTIGGQLEVLECNSDNVYSFSLKHNETIQIAVPYGCRWTVTEDNVPGYSTDIVVGGKTETSTSAWSDIADENVQVTFINTKSVDTPTGIFSNNTPYLMMFAIAAIGAAEFIYPTCWRRRRKEEQ